MSWAQTSSKAEHSLSIAYRPCVGCHLRHKSFSQRNTLNGKACKGGKTKRRLEQRHRQAFDEQTYRVYVLFKIRGATSNGCIVLYIQVLSKSILEPARGCGFASVLAWRSKDALPSNFSACKLAPQEVACSCMRYSLSQKCQKRTCKVQPIIC